MHIMDALCHRGKINNRNKFIIVSWMRINIGKHCNKGYYLKYDHPQYYHKCSLKNFINK